MKKDIKNFIWNNIGLTFNSFNSLFFLIIVKHINGADIAGIFTYSFSLCCLFYIISNYYNRAYQVADYSNKNNFNEYFSCRIVTSVLSMILLIMFAFISKFNTYKIIILIMIMLYRIIESISDCFYGEIQKKDELYKVGISLTIKSLLGLFLFILFDLIFKNVIYSIFSLIIINLIVFIFYDLKNYNSKNNCKLKFGFSNIKSLLIIAFPVFIFSFLSMYLANCQKYTMTYYLSDEMQTIFGILIMPATMLSLVGNYIIMPFVNKLVNYYNEKKYDKFKKMALQICGIFIFVGIIVLIVCYYLGIPILNLVYGMNLNQYKKELLIMIIAAIMLALSLILSSFLTILGENKKQTIIYLISCIIATITSLLLIKGYAIEGATYSYLISFLVNVTLYLGLYIKKIHTLKEI